MLRSRTIREGSVGLLALVGIVLFGAIALWLRGINLGEDSYEIVAEFPNVIGLQVGEPVRYRGLKVGKIKAIEPGSNGVDVTMEIFSSKLIIPKEATIQASSSGLIGETFIDIIPQEQLPPTAQAMNPLADNCDSKTIICDSDRLQGQPGVTLDDLLPLMFRMTSLYSDPRFFDNINSAAQNASVAATELAQLSREVTTLVENVQGEVGNFSDAAKAIAKIANDSSSQITATADQYQKTAKDISELAKNTNELITQNRTTLVTTLNTISDTSNRLRDLVGQFDSALASTNTEQLMQDLATLTANAAAASANLKDISATFSDPNSVVTLQQTLDSARVTFANAQKITADLEEITGDPDFLNNVRKLVDGLSNLLSSTQQLEQQVENAQLTKPAPTKLNFELSHPIFSPSVTNRFINENLINSDQNQNNLLLPKAINYNTDPLSSKLPIPKLNKQSKQ
jgi:phospholipid/cholesterol/gamma-HCH transport system substrate-binding protein